MLMPSGVANRPLPSRAGRGSLAVSQLSKSYGEGDSAVHVLDALDFRADPGEFICIVGPSGVGKTTLLRCLAGLASPTSGVVSIDGVRLNEPSPHVSVVFQDYGRSLMPWMTALENVEFPLIGKGVSKRQRRDESLEALQRVGLDGVGDRYPWQMSGGMQQRVAIARALAYRAEIILADEPFASVDAQTRLALEDLLLELRASLDITVVLVTHDVDEAIYLGDRVVVLSGRPASVVDVIDIGFGRHRSQITTRSAPEFGSLRARVLSEISGGTKMVKDGTPPTGNINCNSERKE